MKNGNIEGGVIPTQPTLPTQPTTSTQPTTAQPTTAQPTTQPATTQPATEPTTVPSQTLTVNATSNYFGSATKTEGKVSDKVSMTQASLSSVWLTTRLTAARQLCRASQTLFTMLITM